MYNFPIENKEKYFKNNNDNNIIKDKNTSIILITGITGLIGSNVCRSLLLNPKNKIYGLIRLRSDLSNLIGILDKITLKYGDITDSFQMNSMIKEISPDYIYHFAAQSTNGISETIPELTLQTNIMGTFYILEALKNNQLFHCRFILASSSTVYGESAKLNPKGIAEDIPTKPITMYGTSKLSDEVLSLTYYYNYNLPVIILRFFIQIGKESNEFISISSFAKQIALLEFEKEKNMNNNKSILYHGNLNTFRDISNIEETTPYIILIAENSNPAEIFNIGSGILIEIKELIVEAVKQSIIPIELQFDPKKFRNTDEHILLADISKLKNFIFTHTGQMYNPIFHKTEVIRNILQYWRQKIKRLYI